MLPRAHFTLVVPRPSWFSSGVANQIKSLLLGAALIAAGMHAQAQDQPAQPQELQTQPTPFTALIDFRELQVPYPPKEALPIWLESVQISHSDPGTPAQTSFRLRLRQLPGLNDSILLRLYFQDDPKAHPMVTAWTETGDEKFASQPLGAGLGLPISESLAVPVTGADYIEISVPGDGSNIKKALVATLRKTEVSSAFDFDPAASVSDPFGNGTPAKTNNTDLFVYGRVRATLSTDPIQISGSNGGIASFAFDLDSPPLVALITFEVLNADPTAPLQAWINKAPIGDISASFPDLADPAYLGDAVPLEGMRFNYTGWIKCQKVIRGTDLRAGGNTLTIQLPDSSSGPVVVRAVELQLKYNWKQLDYTLSP